MLKERAGEQARVLPEHLDRWMSERDRYVKPRVPGTGRVRAGVGIYYFREEHKGENERFAPMRRTCRLLIVILSLTPASLTFSACGGRGTDLAGGGTGGTGASTGSITGFGNEVMNGVAPPPARSFSGRRRKRNQTKRNQTKPNQTKRNQTKPNQQVTKGRDRMETMIGKYRTTFYLLLALTLSFGLAACGGGGGGSSSTGRYGHDPGLGPGDRLHGRERRYEPRGEEGDCNRFPEDVLDGYTHRGEVPVLCYGERGHGQCENLPHVHGDEQRVRAGQHRRRPGDLPRHDRSRPGDGQIHPGEHLRIHDGPGD